MANRTPLYNWHVAHGARMVDFAGWEMPVQYTSIISEHQAVRTSAGLFDIAHMGRLWFEGPDALDLVQRIYTNNAATLKEGQARYGLICNEQGGILDDVLVYRWTIGLAMVVNASNREKILAWAARHRGDRSVKISDLTNESFMVAVQGPEAMERLRGMTPAEIETLPYYHAIDTTYREESCIISRTGYTGEDGFEMAVGAGQALILWEELVARGITPCGLGARDSLRLEAAMPLYGHELSEEIDPLQAGLGWAVKFDKGDFIGREALLLRQEDQSRPRRVGLELASKRIAREGCRVIADEKDVGQVTSGTFAPTLQKSIAMAYVDPMYSAARTKLRVDVRGHEESATVVKLPFYYRKRE